MSPTVNAVEPRAQSQARVGHERANSFEGEDDEVKAVDVVKTTQEKLLDLMTGLSERMERLEASQDEKKRLKEEEQQRVEEEKAKKARVGQSNSRIAD